MKVTVSQHDKARDGEDKNQQRQHKVDYKNCMRRTKPLVTATRQPNKNTDESSSDQRKGLGSRLQGDMMEIYHISELEFYLY